MSNYNYFDKVLNQQFLGENELSNFLYNRIISKAISNKSNLIRKKHIFITGFARAGTTAILNQLYSSDELCSLLYKHMPFVLSPKLASLASFLSKKKDIQKPRLHKDGLMINNNSPECLDEIFWIKSSKDYQKMDLKEPNKIDTKTLLGYEHLLSSFSNLQNGKRLVIKNNNNHIRLRFLSEHFNYCDFLVIFRNPIYHSYSLLKTHQRFYKLQTKDPYILEYMNLIGHREFGIGLKKFNYIDNLVRNKYSPTSINYWLCNWINCYSRILRCELHKKNNIHLIQYEKLCKDESYLKGIYKFLNLSFDNKNTMTIKNKLSPKQKSKLKIDHYLERLSLNIFAKLRKYNFK